MVEKVPDYIYKGKDAFSPIFGAKILKNGM